MEWRRISSCDTRAVSCKSQQSFQASAFALAPSGSCAPPTTLTLAPPAAASTDGFSATAAAAAASASSSSGASAAAVAVDSSAECVSLVCSSALPTPVAPELPLPAPAPAAQASGMSLEDLYLYKPQKARELFVSASSSEDPWKELKPITNRFEVLSRIAQLYSSRTCSTSTRRSNQVLLQYSCIVLNFLYCVQNEEIWCE